MGAFDALRHGEITCGIFGNHTSTIDWCELNYTHSPYIAEFVNTLTNVPTILLGIYGYWRSLENGIKRRYAITYLGLSLIGVGSFGFHASLMWEWQLMDELPMIYVITHCLYLVLDTLPTFKPRLGLLGPSVVVSWDIFVTFSYLYLPNPIYHQVAFACILLSSLFRNVYLINQLPKTHPVRGKITRTLLWGVGTFAAGFAVWNLDNVFCTELRRAREYMGPLGFLLQGHGYWHILTAYGSLLIFASSTLLTLAVKVGPDAYDYNEHEWVPITRNRLLDPSVTDKSRGGAPKKARVLNVGQQGWKDETLLANGMRRRIFWSDSASWRGENGILNGKKAYGNGRMEIHESTRKQVNGR